MLEEADGFDDAVAERAQVTGAPVSDAPESDSRLPSGSHAAAVVPRDMAQRWSSTLAGSVFSRLPWLGAEQLHASLPAKLFQSIKGAESLLSYSKGVSAAIAASNEIGGLGQATGAASVLSGLMPSTRLWQSAVLGSLSTRWANVLPPTGVLDSTGATSALATWMSVQSERTVIDVLGASMTVNVGAQAAAVAAVERLYTGLFSQLDWVADLTSGLRLARIHLPPNWRLVDLEPKDIEDQVRTILEEGIPLAWVPSGRVIESLLNAGDAATRRRVIASNHKGILTGCEEVLTRIATKPALFYVDMARKAILALRDGHVEAAQSLATNVLDTLVNQHSMDALGVAPGVMMNASSYEKFKKRSWRLTLAVHPVTTIMRGRFTVHDRPGGYRRNATSHAITRHQYNRINAVLAIMNATSLLACFVRDTPAFDLDRQPRK
ncbi:hypothetical protein ACIPY5_15015 [Microbacterium sp. NPDC089698]|uniref:hypothetical protein n=1 Tax=Microbacterium sp. NPDC089698 TaxID=3364200 RepID=UPI00382F4212